MHFCSATVRLTGDLRNTVARTTFHPVSWPEIEVLRHLHGHDAVIDVKPFVTVEQSAKAEKERLRLIYGNVVLEDVFPGRNPQMEMEAPGAKLPEPTPTWQNPMTGEMITATPPAEVKQADRQQVRAFSK